MADEEVEYAAGNNQNEPEQNIGSRHQSKAVDTFLPAKFWRSSDENNLIIARLSLERGSADVGTLERDLGIYAATGKILVELTFLALGNSDWADGPPALRASITV
ncbi:hypothetical protein N7468_006143 [Penicillium chermesinum]|uniref:Uncharacterized protein n=1 Tax=Penicillium chermesinum TaxID=63820 RepID=A0A9W9P2X6_9EURO|nr:uncharacterized protein N7468_006143 [Penicillium chermesinum]KAJ5233187.1 hypothetical protein N7468_006143 [Penicillium chermesinum]